MRISADKMTAKPIIHEIGELLENARKEIAEQINAQFLQTYHNAGRIAREYGLGNQNGSDSVRQCQFLIADMESPFDCLRSGDSNFMFQPESQHGIDRLSDVCRDPGVLAFLGVPRCEPELKGDLKASILERFKHFLLGLENGFMFAGANQEVDNRSSHHAEMVFYQKKLRAYILIEMHLQKRSFEDVSRLKKDLRHYWEKVNDSGDNPPIGIIVSAEKDGFDAEYVLCSKPNDAYGKQCARLLPRLELLLSEAQAVTKEWQDAHR